MFQEDHEIEALAKDFENRIKQHKENFYRLTWYMRGGVSFETLFYDTDVGDAEMLNNIIKGNIENTKNAKMPLI